MMDELNQKMILEITGILWERKQRRILFSSRLRETNEMVYLESPDATEKIYARAESLGISVGELVDQVNQEISQKWEKRNQQDLFVHRFEWTFRLDPDKFDEMASIILGEHHD